MWFGGVGSGSLNDEFCAFMTRSLSESRRELFAVDVLGLSLSEMEIGSSRHVAAINLISDTHSISAPVISS